MPSSLYIWLAQFSDQTHHFAANRLVRTRLKIKQNLGERILKIWEHLLVIARPVRRVMLRVKVR